MLDLKLIREQTDLVKRGIAAKGADPAIIDRILALDTQKRHVLTRVEALRAESKKIDYKSEDGLRRAREIKDALAEPENDLTPVENELNALLLTIPNIPETDVPVGEGELANRVIKTVGKKTSLANPLDHVAIAENLGLIDIERGVKVAESRFAFLKNQAVFLELALIRLALEITGKHGFVPMITPELVNGKTVTGTGYLPLGADEVYKTQDDLYLIGTSELALIGYHQDEVLDLDSPKRYVGISSCFRREAGSYGKDTRGIFRMHQFDKVEMVSYVKPEDSAKELDLILSIEEELMQRLELPYHILEIGTGDLGMQAARKYDVETWLPAQEKYRETHSCSNTTDFQTRRLNIKFKNAEGKQEFAHTLNGTAVAVGRMLIAILENYQQPDGSVLVPKALVPFTGFERIG